MSQRLNFTGYIGSIGKDKYGTLIQEKARADGVQTAFYLADKPTGTCAVCIKEKERSLVANLSAANSYQGSHINTPEAQTMVRSARIYYSAGFFLTVSPDTIIEA